MMFDSWYELARVAVSAFAAYVGLVVLLRISGKRTLAKLNAFDFVVTVALGSTLATIALSADTALTEGAAVLVSLVALQAIVAWLSSRVLTIRRMVKSEPVTLALHGELFDDAIQRQRMSPDEVRQAVRSSGVGGLELVGAVVMETDGTLSVIPSSQFGSGSALDGRNGGANASPSEPSELSESSPPGAV